jgi:5-hydroxyisourate hydrolase
MSGITCHVLDTSLGKPAGGVQVRLECRGSGQTWQTLGQALTNADGRVPAFEPVVQLATGEHRITFDTGSYFVRQGQPIFYPRVEVTFHVSSAAEHYHIPLLLSPYGYSTYRGS